MMRSGAQPIIVSIAVRSFCLSAENVMRMSRGIEPCGSWTPPSQVNSRIHNDSLRGSKFSIRSVRMRVREARWKNYTSVM